MFRAARAAFVLCALAAAAAGCAAPCADPQVRIELYLGRDGPAGDTAAFAAFIAAATAELDGYTLLDAAGGWRPAPDAPPRTEPASVLIVVVPREGLARTNAILDRLAAQYLGRFGQQEVLRVDQAACVTTYRPLH